MFPFEFGRKAFAGPSGKSVGFVVAHMADWCLTVDGSEAVQGHHEPCAVLFAPVRGRAPAFRAGACPAVGEPMPGGSIAAVIDEGEPFAVGNQPVHQAEWCEEHFVTRCFVVEAKFPASVAGLDNATVKIDERLRRRGALFTGPERSISRKQGVLREGIE